MKKKVLLSILIFFCVFRAGAQLSITNGAKACVAYQSFAGVDYVFFFAGLDPAACISYQGTGSSVNWYGFSDPATPISNQKDFYNFDNASGYILEVDGVRKATCWVIDFMRYQPNFRSLAAKNGADPCQETVLELDADVPKLFYRNFPQLQELEIPREYSLAFKTLRWGGKEWQRNDTTLSVAAGEMQLRLNEPPLCSTNFTLTASDVYTKDLGLEPLKMMTAEEYRSPALATRITTVTSVRKEKHEDDRPERADVLKGSAPLDILFNAHGSDAVEYNTWSIYKNDELLTTRNASEHRYTFSEYGKYKVKLLSSNALCSAADSVAISISESALWVPNAFTPNGDGVNDEFRVAYRSLKTFECRVYNRWGRRVYFSTDPQKGWDGNFDGRPAAAAPYFYVVTGEGTDGVKYFFRGDINLLR